MAEKKWKEFEKNATNLLNKNVDEYTFINEGNSDSTAPDIKVFKNKNRISNIEAKYSPSQAGQIVVIDEKGKFKFSDKSKEKETSAGTKIINKINSNYSKYKDVQQTGINIDIDEKILFSHIKEKYKEKDISFIIASKESENLNSTNTCLIKIDEIENYFNITATVRRKKSGTSHVPKKEYDEVKKAIQDTYGKGTFKEDGKKLLFQGNINDNSESFGSNHFLSKKSDNEYYVKKKSSTNNINIMFSLELKDKIKFNNTSLKDELDNRQ